MKESDMQSEFSRWLKTGGGDGFDRSTTFELKLTKGGQAIPFRVVKEHQVDGLNRSSWKDGLYWKITDLSLGSKPFDCMWLIGCRAYVVLGWWDDGRRVDGLGLRWYGIDIDRFEEERKKSKQRSLTEKRAGEICEFSRDENHLDENHLDENHLGFD